MKTYGLFRGTEQIGHFLFKSIDKAKEEMLKANRQFKEYNEYVKKNNLNRELIKDVEVKEVNFNRRENLDL